LILINTILLTNQNIKGKLLLITYYTEGNTNTNKKSSEGKVSIIQLKMVKASAKRQAGKAKQPINKQIQTAYNTRQGAKESAQVVNQDTTLTQQGKRQHMEIDNNQVNKDLVIHLTEYDEETDKDGAQPETREENPGKQKEGKELQAIHPSRGEWETAFMERIAKLNPEKLLAAITTAEANNYATRVATTENILPISGTNNGPYVESIGNGQSTTIGVITPATSLRFEEAQNAVLNRNLLERETPWMDGLVTETNHMNSISYAEIWTEFEYKEAVKIAKNIPKYNPQDPDLALRDYCAWFDHHESEYESLGTYKANYVLTLNINSQWINSFIKQKGKQITTIKTEWLARHYGQLIYPQLRINPLEYAKTLRIQRDKIFSMPTLFKRVMNLHYCSSEPRTLNTFCYGLTFAIGAHIDRHSRPYYYQQISMFYPDLFRYAAQLNARAIPVLEELPLAPNANRMPKNSTTAYQFSKWLVDIASLASPIDTENALWELYGTTGKEGRYGTIVPPEDLQSTYRQKLRSAQPTRGKFSANSAPTTLYKTMNPNAQAAKVAQVFTRPPLRNKEPYTGTPCIHCKNNTTHSSDQCWTKYPHLRPIKNFSNQPGNINRSQSSTRNNPTTPTISRPNNPYYQSPSNVMAVDTATSSSMPPRHPAWREGDGKSIDFGDGRINNSRRYRGGFRGRGRGSRGRGGFGNNKPQTRVNSVQRGPNTRSMTRGRNQLIQSFDPQNRSNIAKGENKDTADGAIKTAAPGTDF
jgi:hypothetical protein